MSASDLIVVEKNNGVGIIRLNRPDKLNAISPEMMEVILATLQAFDADNTLGCSVIMGSAKAFAAGADIGHMATATAEEMLATNPFTTWDALTQIKKPIIAAVSGYCFGGGCELAMTCDVILAADNAQFSQPEVNLGIIPGAGGTQRLVRAVGKSKAMELILSGRRLSAAEALSFGLVAAVYPVDDLEQQALALATEIAQKPKLAIQQAKHLINQAYELNLQVGLDVERTAFYALFDSEDKKEGMAAFLEKRPAQFK